MSNDALFRLIFSANCAVWVVVLAAMWWGTS